ncbi:MAG: acetolactate synthase large subunit [Methylocystis sp.]|nr:acetolactate synthase large subunit [Methylocystis sp.]MCA3585006.1 acetolactate synthase large subunit [Methylocystis sp.]MCA3586936.1 acetolactate synthase large subunit [Methylocystis sp.]MCA3592224.1 acetolactate synthase large subunit [Methylocystis sp.]
MNGAESLVRTLVAGGVDTCFSNPGTSEMHFVAALDRVDGMDCVLCLFEGVATGAADGWARMTGRPGLTLLHLGPGLANGLANLHNAKKAGSPIVNIVGEHTTQHLAYEAPLTSDTEGVARPMSHWVRTGRDSTTIAAEGAEAIAAARRPPGQIATLILPADTAWGPGGPVAAPLAVAPPAKVEEARVAEAAAAVRKGKGTLLLLGGSAVREGTLDLAAAIAARTGARIMGRTSLARIERGAGRIELPRLPYYVDQALEALKDVETLILVSADDPVSFFGYPGKPSRMAPPGAKVLTLAGKGDDLHDALARLADAVGARAADALRASALRTPLPTGKLTVENAMRSVAALLPEGAVIVDESVSSARFTAPLTIHAAPHDWLQLTGGAIGLGPPMALGAAVAAKDRKIVNLQADGSAMYTLQALWSQARAGADVLTVIWSNAAYAILSGELMAVGASNPGRKALDMLSLDDPALDWVKLAEGMGVPALRCDTAEAFTAAFQSGLKERGPFLIEAIVR